MLKILVFEKTKKMFRLELGNVLGVKLGILKDSELIGTMYLSLKSLVGWIMTIPTLIVLFKIRLVSISLQFLYKIICRLHMFIIHSIPFLLQLEALGLMYRP